MLLPALLLCLTAAILWMASKSSIEAGRGHVTLGVNIDPLVKGLEAAQKKFAAWGKGMEVAGAAMGAASTSMQAPFIYALHVLTEDGNHLYQVARQTGISIAELGPLAYATGGDLDALATAVRKMNSFLEQASHAAPNAQRALNELGLTFQELNGLTTEQRLERIADALSHVHDAGQRSALQTQILGRAAGALNLSGGQEGLQRRQENARRLGVLSPEDVALARQLSVAERELGTATRTTWGFIGAAVAPYMTTFVRQVTEIVLVIQHWVRENGPLLLILFKVAEWVGIIGGVIGALGVGIYVASFAFSFLAGAVGIVGAALSALWGFAVFASSGFGILGASVFSWSTITSAASGIATAAMWAWGAVVGVVTGVQSAYNAVLGIFGLGATAAAGASGTAAAATGAWGIVTATASGIATAAMATWAAAVFAVQTAHAIGLFAVTGFGLATAAATALTWLDNAALGVWTAGTIAASIASSAWTAAVWLLTTAYAASTASLWGFGAVGVAMDVLSFAAAAGAAVWSAATWALSAATTVATAVLGIFTGATAASTVWAWASNAALGVWAGAVWLVSAAHAAAVGVLALFTGATVVAQAGTHGFSLGLIFAWIWENIASAGIYLLVTAIGVLIVALGAVALALGAGVLIAFVGLLADLVVESGVAQSAWGQFVDFFGATAGRAWESCKQAFAGILDTVKTTMGGVMDAVSAGNWGLVWDLVKTGAELAWRQITLFVQQQWIIWKGAALDVWHTITDWLEDAFHDVVTSIEVLFAMTWSEIGDSLKETFAGIFDWIASKIHDVMATILTTVANVFRALWQTDRANAAQTAAAEQTALATTPAAATPRTPAAIREAAAEAQRARDAARRERARIAAELAAAETAGLDDGEIDRLRERLQTLRDAAHEEAAMREWMSQTGEAGPHGGEEGFTSKAKAGPGSFFADALAGMFGAGGATVQDRQLRAQNRTNQLLAEIASRLNRMDGGAFA